MNERMWYRRFGADFIAGTLNLTLEQKGAYSLVLDLIYDRGGPIPDDDRYIAGVCGCSIRKWASIKSVLVSSGKIILVDGRITNRRAEDEIEIRSKKARKLAENGAKGGEKRAENIATSNKNNELDVAKPKHHVRVLEARDREDITKEDKSSLGGEPPKTDLFENLQEAQQPEQPALGEDPNARLFEAGVIGFVVARSTAKDDRTARQLLGRWKKSAGGDAELVVETLKRAQAMSIMDLTSWMPKAIEAKLRPAPRAPMWRPGMPIIVEQGKPDAFGRSPSHPCYGSQYAV